MTTTLKRSRCLLVILLAILAGVLNPTKAHAAQGNSDGVYAFGAAPFKGGPTDAKIAVAGMATTKTGDGYWLVSRDGGVFAYGDAAFHGSLGGTRLNQPIVGMAATPSGNGYWLVASDGGIFAFGDAAFHGSMGHTRLNQPVVGMASSKTGDGYWFVARDGGIFAFGDALFYGSTGGIRLNQPVVAMAASPSGHGYWFTAADGGVFNYGDAAFHGSTGSLKLERPIVGIAANPTGSGYWLAQGAKSIPLITRSPITADLVAFLNGRSARVSVAVYDNTTGQTFTYRPEQRFYCASIMKVNIMQAVMKQGASVAERNRMVPMIQQSDNGSASELFYNAGGYGGILAYDRSIGAMTTERGGNSGEWGLTRTSAADQALLVRQLAYPSTLSDSDRQYGLHLMRSVAPSQKWGVTAGTPGATVAVKNGWLNYRGSWIVNSIGHVKGGGRDYTIAVLTESAPSMQYGISTIEGASSRVFAALK